MSCRIRLDITPKAEYNCAGMVLVQALEVLYASWGKAIARRRAELKLSQQQLADALGIRQATVSKLERGRLCPSDTMKFKLAAALQKSPEDLFRYPAVVPSLPDEEPVA